MNRKDLLIALTMAALFVAGAARGQRFGESVQVTVIEVPVTVSDSAGKPMRGLTKENFEVYDDGKRVPIEYFETVDLAEVRTDAKKTLPPAAYRNFMLLFDLANSTPATIGRAQEAAREFVTSQLKDRDLVAVATYSAQNGMSLLTSFTSDRRLTSTAIDTLGKSASFKVADALRLTAELGPLGNTQSQGVAGSREEIAAILHQEYAELTKANVASHEDQMRTRVRTQLMNFAGVARALDRLHGQKQIILLSEGFDPKFITGRQQLGFQNTQAENDAVLSGEIWNVDSEQRFGSTTGQSEIQQMADLFKRSDVRLHAIDIKGIRADVDAREGAMRSSNEGLYLVTRPTGGTVFKNANDLGANFDRLLAKQEVIYLLGFSARNTGKPGKFHNLRVKTTVRGAEVSHRSGYYEPSDRVSELAQTLTMAEVLVTDAPIRDVPLSVVVAAAPGPQNVARVPVVVEIPGTQLLQGVTGKDVRARLFIYAFDSKGEVRDSIQQPIGLDLAKVGDALRKSGIRYIGALRLPAGNYAVKALIRVEETGRMGFLRTDLTVPAFTSTSVLAPLAIGDPQSWVMVLDPARRNDATSVLTLGGQPLVPQARTAISNTTDQRVALLLYRMPMEDLAVTPAVISPDGSSREVKLALVGRTAADPSGVSKLVFNFKPEGLAHGDYNLSFTITPKGGTSTVAMLPFTVQ